MTQKKRGGSGRGQGRKPLKAGEETVTLSLRVTVEQRDKLTRLGGAKWVRSKIDLGDGTMEWQPIETAPKDGTEILGYDIGDDAYYLARFVHPYQLKPTWIDSEDKDILITHWMPLPEAPSEPSSGDVSMEAARLNLG